MKTIKTAGSVVLLIALLVTVIACAGTVPVVPVAQPAAPAATTAPQVMEPIKIGYSAGITGPFALSGVNQLNGVKLAIEEINEAGGVLGGRPLQLIIEDNKGVPAEAVSAYNRLYDVHQVPVTIGAGSSGNTLAVLPVVKEAQIPNVEYVATNPTIDDQQGVGGNEWAFRINAPDDAFATVAGEAFVNSAGWKRFSALVSDDDFGRGAFAAQRKTIEEAGGEIISEDYFALNETDFLSILTKIKAANPDSILAFINVDPTLIAAKQYKELGMTIPWSGRGQYFTEQMKTDIGCETIAGWASIDPWFNTDPDPRSVEFVRKIKENYGVDAVWQHLTAYTAAYVVADAINRAGSAEPAAIRDALQETNYDSILGNLKFDDHNQAHGNVYAAQMQPDCTLKVIFKGAF
jgi:branched-chain amino acid transport system substrate-binding protein